MTKLEIELHDNIISVLHKLKNINDTGIELVVPEGSVIFENILNLKLIQKWSEKEEKVISFQTDDQNGQNMLASMENGNEFPDEMAQDTSSLDEELPQQKISMPKFRFSLPTIKLKKGKIVVFIAALLILLGLLGFGAYRYAAKQPIANIKIIVNSQPLTRSLEIKVADGEETDAENKILQGATVAASVEDNVTVETTGEKIVGEKAEGEIVIYNKTDEEKEFEDGTEVIFEDDDDDEFVYELKDDVTVPPREEASDSTPANPKYISGSAEVDVEAKEIGKDYNIDEGESLEIEDQDDSDYVAEVYKDIDGGKKETVLIVAQEDIDTAATKLLEDAEETAYRALDEKISGGQKLINGSQSVAVIKEEYSHILGEETEELTLSQSFASKGLVYKPEDLDKLIDELIQEFIPEDFILSTKERVLNVEILGNTETTTLNELEADIQVTIKTFVVTAISEDSIKKELMGKNVGDAQKYIGSIKNIKTYEFSIDPRIPLLDFVPKDEGRIIIKLERE